MDPRRNRYAPGAGTPPPELAGPDEIIERASIALDRIRAGRAARSVVLYGLRGVGKTVLLQRIRQNAEGEGYHRWPREALDLVYNLHSAATEIVSPEAAKEPRSVA